MNTKLININYKNVFYNYGKTKVLKDISFNVKQGECCALIGHNGTGKTTLIKLLLGLIKTNKGEIRLCQQNPVGKLGKQAKSHVGFVPEIINFQSNYTGLELMQYVAKLKSVNLNTIEEKMQQTNIEFAKNKKIAEYSKGMKQRLGLAQAMLGNPNVLILDEPASGLDPDSRMILYENLKKHTQRGNTVMFSSHALNDIEPYIDKVVLLNQGKVLIDSDIAEYKKQALEYPVTINIEVLEQASELIAKLSLLGKLEYKANIISLIVDSSKKLEAIAIISQDSSVVDMEILNVSLEKIYHKLLEKETKKEIEK